MRPSWREWRVMTSWQHMHFSAWQFEQTPASSHGVPVCRRAALSGHVTVRMRLSPDIRHDFVHTGDDADMLGTMEQQGEAVGVAVDVDEFAVGVMALVPMKNQSASTCSRHMASCSSGVVACERSIAVTVGLQGRFDAAFGKRDASAPGDALARFYGSRASSTASAAVWR